MTEIDINHTLSWDMEKFNPFLDWLASIKPNWTYNTEEGGILHLHRPEDATYFFLRFS